MPFILILMEGQESNSPWGTLATNCRVEKREPEHVLAEKGHVFYCDSSREPNFFKPQTHPLLENLINIVVGSLVGRTLTLQNALKLL